MRLSKFFLLGSEFENAPMNYPAMIRAQVEDPCPAARGTTTVRTRRRRVMAYFLVRIFLRVAGEELSALRLWLEYRRGSSTNESAIEEQSLPTMEIEPF